MIETPEALATTRSENDVDQMACDLISSLLQEWAREDREYDDPGLWVAVISRAHAICSR